MLKSAELHRITDHWGFVDGDGFKMYLAKNDDAVAMKLLHGIPYEQESMKLWKKICTGAELVIDVGAHTGIYSLTAWQVAEAVASVEPFCLNYARLLINLRANGRPVEGVIFACASDKTGVSCLMVKTARGYCSTGGSVHGADGYEYVVPVAPLDDMVTGKVTAVKIDAEGHGKHVLRGMTRILADRPDLILEATESGLGEILKPLGYKFYRIDEETGLEPVDDIIPEFINGRPVMTRLNVYATVNG